jgi:hypothetical protein
MSSQRDYSHPTALTLAPTGSASLVAQLHANLQYPDPGHWSQQMDWHDDVDNYERTHVTSRERRGLS